MMNELQPLISICSFGFQRSGIPPDPSGHNGGFVFDCRGLPNPGRDPAFARLTGEDAPVQRYLEKHEQVGLFLDHALALILLNARNYRERQFERLMVSFGCTGGQHRSVYCALRAAARLRELGFQVELRHLDKPEFS